MRPEDPHSHGTSASCRIAGGLSLRGKVFYGELGEGGGAAAFQEFGPGERNAEAAPSNCPE
jgi:hypothetical protein